MRFDSVIIGGGSAGCVVAGRLSEDPARRVCLLEAGPENSDPRIQIPVGVVAVMGHPRFDWRFQSAPHRHLADRRVPVPRGKTLGGSGSINSMVYIRGRASDYDGWAAAGCTGWDWESVLPWFKRAENNRELGEDDLHGNDGPLHVQDLPSPHPMIRNYISAGAALDIPYNRDFNGVAQLGLGNYQTTMNDGTRFSPADAYLAPIRSQKNIEVITDCLVDRIEFEGRRAVTIHARRGNQSLRIDVDGEVITSAGAIGSPAVLMRSGVGPAEHLRGLGIKPLVELDGVGENLHDHPAFGVHYAGGKQGYALSLTTALENLAAPFRYLLSRKGLLSSNTVEGGGFACTRDGLAEPDVQFHFIPARVGHEGSMLTWGRGYYSDVCLLKPESRGRLKLASRDPQAAPDIDLNLLATAEDRAVFLRGVKLLRRLLAHPDLTGGDAIEVMPGESVQTDEELMDVIGTRLGTAYHPVGTCRMGSSDDPRAVVDAELRVIGLENVSVADASIMPEIVAGNTNAPSMMIGEVAADRIRRRHGK
ncbi:MAG: GMC family oxidoreductase N-terminal domain-containing protein [Woeseiaceae bacterium]|nr:GMC family oxidoreductase N-terminal domain-containing protein [Woeseiaceae bacterium]